MLDQSRAMISVKQLRMLMRGIPNDYLIEVNQVGNLTILERQEDGFRYAGYIEIGNESIDLFAKQAVDKVPRKFWTDDKLAEIIALRESGMAFSKIGNYYNISGSHARTVYLRAIRVAKRFQQQ